MDPPSRKVYLDDLMRRIERGFFFSDAIMDNVINEIAPAISDSIDRELSFN